MFLADLDQRGHVFSFERWRTPGIALELDRGSVGILFCIRLLLMEKLPVHVQDFRIKGFVRTRSAGVGQ